MKAGQQFYYIASIATDEVDRGKSLYKQYSAISLVGANYDTELSHAVIRHLQDEARRTKHPIWLEASTPYSRGLYASLGFELVEEFVIGKGTAGKDGFRKQGGEGVTVAAMIWWGDIPRGD